MKPKSTTKGQNALDCNKKHLLGAKDMLDAKDKLLKIAAKDKRYG